jgi:hypothetical protein
VLVAGDRKVAEAAAVVQVVRCQIPQMRKIGFVPDRTGRLEDFLRMAHASFQPFTAQSLIRAPLEAYGMIIIGERANDYYEAVRGAGDRLRDYVNNGGELIVFGQEMGWPHDLFSGEIYPSAIASLVAPKVIESGHPAVSRPYGIDIEKLAAGPGGEGGSYPAVIRAGAGIISAGELGTYLQVLPMGEGRVIYCGLPLFEMAARLNVEAIHLVANLLSFGYE